MDNKNYLEKDSTYFINARLDLINLMPLYPLQKVLEIGMGGGDTLVHIKKNKLAAEVTGIDIMKLPGTNQDNSLIDKILFLDVDKVSLPFSNDYFDVIIAGDVLEHLIDPWKVIENMTAILKPGGCIIVSLPNIRDIYALYPIFLKGKFEYAERGIFDKTHFRFFCKIDMIKLIENRGGLKIENIMPIHNFGKKQYKRKIFNRLTLNIFEEFVTSQYLFKAVKVKDL